MKRTMRAYYLLLLILPLNAVASADQTELREDAGQYLDFVSELDGRCHNLSEGGKLRVMHNSHPDHPIKYRLVRMFAGKPQMGLAIGTIQAAESKKLGCTRVDGREQTWVVERAELLPAGSANE
jgi:hypothetical protein